MLGYGGSLCMLAIKDGEYVWYTTFTTELGEIELSLVEGTKYQTAKVRLLYSDKANSDKVRKAAMDDL